MLTSIKILCSLVLSSGASISSSTSSRAHLILLMLSSLKGITVTRIDISIRIFLWFCLCLCRCDIQLGQHKETVCLFFLCLCLHNLVSRTYSVLRLAMGDLGWRLVLKFMLFLCPHHVYAYAYAHVFLLRTRPQFTRAIRRNCGGISALPILGVQCMDSTFSEL